MLALFILMPAAAPPTSGEEAGLAFLARHAPTWNREHRCFSCHHDGDAARALFASGRAPVNTLRWLQRPEGWRHNGGDGPFSDRRLATLQFAAALAEASRAGLLTSRTALTKAARMVAAEQGRDGGWHVSKTLGGPTTWGDALATAMSAGVLRRAGGHRDAVGRAEAWLRAVKPESVPDAAAVLIGLGAGRAALALVEKAERRGGGWGPYASSPPEVFDTALVVIALPDGPMRARGRRWLLEAQEAGGGWEETTRPGGAESYAQRLSTSAWAVLALRASRPAP